MACRRAFADNCRDDGDRTQMLSTPAGDGELPTPRCGVGSALAIESSASSAVRSDQVEHAVGRGTTAKGVH